MCKKPAAARERALDVIEQWYQSLADKQEDKSHPLLSSDYLISEVIELAREAHHTRRDIACMILADAWALLANAPRAVIWTVIKLIEHPDAMARVRSEIVIGLRETSDGQIGSLLQSPSILNSETFGFTNSAIQETLRISSSSYSIRRVANDATIPFPVGSPGTLVKKNDMVVCIGTMNHSDPTIYSNPSEWVAERFTAEFKKGKADRGERDAANGFLPFGGGVSICEGALVL
jgi:cholesterol 7alpha-monooxygenase